MTQEFREIESAYERQSMIDGAVFDFVELTNDLADFRMKSIGSFFISLE